MKNKITTKSIDNFKDFDFQLEIIDFIESLNDVAFEVTDFPGLKGQFTKSGKELSLHFTENNVAARLAQIKFASISIQDKILLMGPLSFASIATNINVKTGIHFRIIY